MKKIRWYYLAAAFVAALLVFGGGIYAWETVREAPVKEEIEAVEGVEEVEVEQKDEDIKVTLELSSVECLQEVITEADNIIETHLGTESTPRYEIINTPCRDLESFQKEILPALHEGARLGNYLEIQQFVSNQAAEHSLEEHGFMVDKDRLYLQARRDENYLYILVPINPDNREEE